MAGIATCNQDLRIFGERSDERQVVAGNRDRPAPSGGDAHVRKGRMQTVNAAFDPFEDGAHVVAISTDLLKPSRWTVEQAAADQQATIVKGSTPEIGLVHGKKRQAAGKTESVPGGVVEGFGCESKSKATADTDA